MSLEHFKERRDGSQVKQETVMKVLQIEQLPTNTGTNLLSRDFQTQRSSEKVLEQNTFSFIKIFVVSRFLFQYPQAMCPLLSYMKVQRQQGTDMECH